MAEIEQVYHLLTIEVEGERLTGRYRVDGELVTVAYHGLTETTQVGGMSVDHLAELLLHDLVRRAKARPR